MKGPLSSVAARVLLALLMTNGLAGLIWFLATRKPTSESVKEYWYRPADFTPSAPLSALPPKERKLVKVERVSRVRLSHDQTVLNLLQLPGYTVGNTDEPETLEQVLKALDAVDERLKEVMMKHWVAPALRVPANQSKAVMSVVLDRDGRVKKRVFKTPSGADLLDSSIVTALSTVGMVQQLPRVYGEGEYEVEVTFVVQ